MSASAQRALDYLEQQPGTTFSKLYQQPSTALAIFRRMLPHLAKNIVMAMLYMPTPFPIEDLESWTKPEQESVRAKDRALQTLAILHIVSQDSDKAGKWVCRLNSAFGKSLRAALTGGGDHRSFGVPCSTPDKNPISVEELDTYARNQWEAILYYVVGSANASLHGEVDISPGTKQLLEFGTFVRVRGKHRSITSEGFTFLLQDVNAQVWSLMIAYLKLAEATQAMQLDSVDILSFLFTLGSLELGVSYSTSNLTPTQLQLLDDLSDFGLIRLPPNTTPKTATRYYPTRLATTLTSSSPALFNSTASSSPSTTTSTTGYLLLETNYRLYAYTSSPLHISILSLFTTLLTRYPNLTTAKITKSSIQTALTTHTLTSAQIITYLSTHAHPIMRTTYPILPPTVTDQIRLWEIENERMTSTQGFYIKDMETPGDYERAVEYAETLGVLVKAFPSKKTFFVSSMEQISSWFKMNAARKKNMREQALLAGSGTSGTNSPR